ncbi:beta-propeller domain-containing protein, partial [Candidatus Woesearchaeota archaeon]|nr:beta-propeller domain-containing protein [Candidatus Woesearchaeota archaeon]
MKQTKFLTGFLILSVLVITVFIAACEIQQLPGDKTPTDTKISQFQTSQQLKKFSSVGDLRKFLDNAALNAGTRNYYGGVQRDVVFSAAIAESAAPMAKSAAADLGAGARATDYSTTNVQVQGVDEADIVKNDDKYIYTLTQNKLVIVDAFPAENAKVLSETKIKGNLRNMFVNKDRLVVFADDNGEVTILDQYDFMPRPRYTQTTHVYVYDVSDRSEPKLVKDYNLNGYYFQSRMIGDYVYFVVQENVYYWNRIIDVPVVMESSKVIARPDIYYFDNPETNYNFNTVASFNIFESKDEVDAKTFMMGYSNNLYVSEDNIYISYQKNLPYNYYEAHNEGRFYDVAVPLFPLDIQSKINDVKNDNNLKSYEKWEQISTILEGMYNGMDKDDRQEVIEKIQNAIEEYEAKLAAERAKTVIHRIAISNGNIEYGAKGEVPGYLLNQFSMDENGDYFRVAT